MSIKTNYTPKNNGVIVLSDAVFSTVPFSVSVWCDLQQLISLHPDGYARIAMQTAAIPAWRLSIVNNGGNQLRFELITIAGASVAINADNFLSINTWCHVAATADNARNMLLYVNGIKQLATNTAASISPANDALCIGIDGSAASGGLPGRVDDFRFYDRVLSESEIKTVYSCLGHDSIETGLVCRYHFAESI
jgi:hypothetical protein